MFTITVETHFWAQHRLVLADDSTEPLHGHNWAVTAEVGAEKLDENNLVMDFRRLKDAVENISAELSGKSLNEIEYFRQNGCSAENVAKFFYEKLRPLMPENVLLTGVSVTEQAGCSAKFTK